MPAAIGMIPFQPLQPLAIMIGKAVHGVLNHGVVHGGQSAHQLNQSASSPRNCGRVRTYAVGVYPRKHIKGKTQNAAGPENKKETLIRRNSGQSDSFCKPQSCKRDTMRLISRNRCTVRTCAAANITYEANIQPPVVLYQAGFTMTGFPIQSRYVF